MSIIFFFLILFSCTPSAFSTKDDESQLLKIKKQLGDPPILSDWVKGFDYCNGRPDIACTSTGRVRLLAIGYFDASAPFPSAICGLSELEELILLAISGLYGPFPSCVNKLRNLRSFKVTYTYLSGPVPGFPNHTNLTTIDLQMNRLSGSIPPSLSSVPNLQYLDLSSNFLTGTIPPALVHGASATLLLQNNSFTGELSECYGSVDFYRISVASNRLSGDASFLFGKQKTAILIDLSSNGFKFDLSNVEIPEVLYGLNVSHNKIRGKVPASLVSTERLWLLDVSYNKLCGEIPQGNYIWRYNAESFANNLCLCGNPLPPCFNLAPAPAPAPAP